MDGSTHIRCGRPLLLNRQFSLWRYEGVIREVLLKLKYQFVSNIAEELIENFVKDMDKKTFPKNSLVVPIPMHPKRKKWRGFNQAEELGKIFAEKLNLEFVPDFLKRVKHTTPQTELRGGERRKNIKGVFSIHPNYTLHSKRSTLILFDDVWTTGSTMKEATKVVKRKYKKVDVIGVTICG